MKKRLKLILIFIAAAAAIQFIALLFFTPSGIEKIYPLCQRAAAEKVKTDGNTYAVYYDMRGEASRADVIVIGIDDSIDLSYKMLGHFTRFIKQYNNVSTIYMDVNKTSGKLIDSLFKQTSESNFNAYLSTIGGEGGLSEAQCTYLSELYFVNSTMPNTKKLTVSPFQNTDEKTESVLLPDIITSAVTSSADDRSTMWIVDSSVLMQDSTFTEDLKKSLPDKSIMFIQTHYTKSAAGPDTETACTFPFEPDKGTVYFVKNSKLDYVYSYYSFVTELFGTNKNLENKLTDRYTDFFFVITGGKSA